MKLKEFCFAMTACVLLLAGTAYAQADARGATPDTNSGSDAWGFRKEKITKESVGERANFPRTPSVRQAMEDFRQLQELNYKLRDQAKVSPLAFEDVEETAKKIKTIAGRLKTSLVLPKTKEKIDIAPAPSSEALVSQIGEMNASVRAFVANPIFRNAETGNKELATDAATNLQKVIELSKALEQSSAKLRDSGQKK